MNFHHSTITRLLLTLLLSMASLALLPLTLTGLETSHSTGLRPPAPGNFTATLALRAKLHPALLKQLLTPSADLLPVIVVMRAQPDLAQPAIASAPTAADRRAVLVAELHATAARSQAGVLALLEQAEQTDRAAEIRSLWINNSIAARVERALIELLAARDDVALIQPDHYRQWVDPGGLADQHPVTHDPHTVEWHITRIRADQVWSALNVTGTGVVVGHMDTGVDWQHPALHDNYRGLSPKGLVNHTYSWFDTTNIPALYPVDGVWHGTHTMGTLAGQNGIGVAPGAKWIAVRIFDNNGSAFDSWIHAGFQWMLAPGGDAAQAPDVLSNSWGNPQGENAEFQPDVRLLNLAGIDTYFSTGNNGPEPSSVGAPASYPESFGVGAVDNTDWIAIFSSRGPSPFGVVRPDVVAPGVGVVSSVPGGVYYPASGTSMAVPHAAGIAALMRSAAAGLAISETRRALTSTAVIVFTGTRPSNTWGWGRVDAFNAVLAVQHPGVISGVVKHIDTGAPISFAGVTIESDLGSRATAQTDKAGQYRVYGAAALYTMTFEAFGYVPRVLPYVPIVTGSATVRDAKLSPLPGGWVTGRLTDLTGTKLLTASIEVENTPVVVAAQGVYSLALPAGTHVLRASASEHRRITATVVLSAGQIVTQSFALPDAPRLLLIDSGRWYNGSEISYYRQALDDLGYPYTEWPLRDPAVDVPTTSTLRAYSTVIWSAPLDSPGFVGVGRVISDYLGSSGRLLLSGQDVGYYDDWWYNEPYFHSLLLAQVAADASDSRQLTGAHSFAGLTFRIDGAGGAQNQLYPDVIRSLVPALTETAFDYAPAENGGHAVGLCRSYRAVYLPFGFEAISDRAARAEVLSRTFEIFERAPIRNTFTLDHTPDQLIGPPGTSVTGTLTLANFDETSPHTFTLSTESAWAVSLTTEQLTLPACEARTITLTVRIPPDAARDATQPVTVTASAPGLPAISTVIRAKAPAGLLLVQDDRWYEVDAPYRSALAANDLSFDVWRVPTSWSGPEAPVPSLDRLKWYAQVIWFTGYDWYQSLTPSNTQLLEDYLDHDGRVLLSSQDAAIEPRLAAFARDTLGVLTSTLEVTVTQISGPRGSIFEGLLLQAIKLPYPNYIPALAPLPDASVALVSEQGWPVALARALQPGKVLFMAFGFEGLPNAVQAEVMNNSVGYLSRLGRSSVQADRDVLWPGETFTLTIGAHNDGVELIHQAVLTFTLPPGFAYVGGDAPTWAGALAAGQSITRALRLKLPQDSSAGTIFILPVELRDDDQSIRFTRAARVKVAGPELELIHRPEAALIRPRQVMTWVLTARNISALSATTYLTMSAPFEQHWISGTLAWSAGQVMSYADRILWRGVLEANMAVTLSAQMTAPVVLPARQLYGSSIAVNDYGVWQAANYLLVQPPVLFFPIVRK
jgi:hypothetical protein